MLAVALSVAALSAVTFSVMTTPALAAPRHVGRHHITTPPPQTDAAGTVWLCRPGLTNDPCDGSMASTVVHPGGNRSIKADTVSPNRRFDCFYLYPTASAESTVNSDLIVQPSETENAVAQAARFSKVCNVWAPMYQQVTVTGLSVANSTDPGAYTVAYDSVLSAWNDFITNDDDGAPIIFIGHSQGSIMLIKLLQAQFDANAALRKLLVQAIIAGGDVTVPTGQSEGATFAHIPLCTSKAQSGCVIAYSSFPSAPPANANFGIPGQGIALNTGQTATTGVQIACVNPADISGGTGRLQTYWPRQTPPPVPSMAPPAPSVTTSWVYYPDQYTARCESAGGATWLQVTDIQKATDTRPVVKEIFGPTWGYHFQDINLAIGNLVTDVRTAEVAYATASRRSFQ